MPVSEMFEPMLAKNGDDAKSSSKHAGARRRAGSRQHTAQRHSVFIDGEAGTTGLEIRKRLAEIAEISVLSIDEAKRKVPEERLKLMSAASLVVLCLPDKSSDAADAEISAAEAAVARLDALGKDGPRVIDASSAHRLAEGWVYGFPELGHKQAAAINTARKVSNPGCYPTGAIALLAPLIGADLIPADYPVTINAVSGYSGGGRKMIEAYEAGTAPLFEMYGLGLEHKHTPEIEKYSGLTRRPLFVPSVGNFRQGMLVSVPLHLDALPGKPKLADLEAVLVKHYAGSPLVSVVPNASKATGGRIDALKLAGTDKLELYVFGAEARRQAVLTARLDNLGKGASGAAVQNMGLMLGVS